jgi:hypothetical protein
VDAKKKELVGNYKNDGRELQCLADELGIPVTVCHFPRRAYYD